MPMPSFEELQAQGICFEDIIREQVRVFETLSPQERIVVYVEALTKHDARFKEASFAFEIAAECFANKPYAYDAIVTLHDRREEIEESFKRTRAWYENEIFNFEREIRSSGSSETEGKDQKR